MCIHLYILENITMSVGWFGSRSCTCYTVIKQYTSLVFVWPSTKKWWYIGIISPSSVCPSVTNIVQTTPQKLLVRFHSNFTGMISTKFMCAYFSIFHFNDISPQLLKNLSNFTEFFSLWIGNVYLNISSIRRGFNVYSQNLLEPLSFIIISKSSKNMYHVLT